MRVRARVCVCVCVCVCVWRFWWGWARAQSLRAFAHHICNLSKFPMAYIKTEYSYFMLSILGKLYKRFKKTGKPLNGCYGNSDTQMKCRIGYALFAKTKMIFREKDIFLKTISFDPSLNTYNGPSLLLFLSSLENPIILRRVNDFKQWCVWSCKISDGIIWACVLILCNQQNKQTRLGTHLIWSEHGRLQRGGATPLKNHKNIGFLSNIGLDPL